MIGQPTGPAALLGSAIRPSRTARSGTDAASMVRPWPQLPQVTSISRRSRARSPNVVRGVAKGMAKFEESEGWSQSRPGHGAAGRDQIGNPGRCGAFIVHWPLAGLSLPYSGRVATTGSVNGSREARPAERAVHAALRATRSASGCWCRGVTDYAIYMLDPTATSRAGTPAPSASRAITPDGDHRPALLALLHRRGPRRRRCPRTRSQTARARGPVREAKAGACARTARASGPTS